MLTTCKLFGQLEQSHTWPPTYLSICNANKSFIHQLVCFRVSRLSLHDITLGSLICQRNSRDLENKQKNKNKTYNCHLLVERPNAGVKKKKNPVCSALTMSVPRSIHRMVTVPRGKGMFAIMKNRNGVISGMLLVRV